MRRFAIAGALALVLGGGAGAHPMPNSTLVVESKPDGVQVDVSIPLTELTAAMGSDRQDLAEAGRYLATHAAIVAPAGIFSGPFVRDARMAPGDHPAFAATLVFAPVARASLRGASLRYDAVTHRIASHYVLVYRRVGGELTPLGRLQAPSTSLPLP